MASAPFQLAACPSHRWPRLVTLAEFVGARASFDLRGTASRRILQFSTRAASSPGGRCRMSAYGTQEALFDSVPAGLLTEVLRTDVLSGHKPLP
jgi:hypothetical protein